MSVEPKLSLHHVQRDHENLHRIMEAIEESFPRTPAGDPDLLRLLELLTVALKAHFLEEEQVMQRCSYPHLSGHKWQHEVLTEHLAMLNARAQAGQQLPATLIPELRHIIVDHMEEADCELIAYVIASKSRDDGTEEHSQDATKGES